MTYLSYLLLISKPLISPAHRCVVDKGLVVAALSVDCEITRCLVDKGLVEASLVVVSVATGCVVVKGLVVAALFVDFEITGCVVDKGSVEASLVVVSVATGCVGVEIPSDDVPLSTIAIINLFMNKKGKVQYVTVVNNS